jgi:hypothetical protein
LYRFFVSLFPWGTNTTLKVEENGACGGYSRGVAHC